MEEAADLVIEGSVESSRVEAIDVTLPLEPDEVNDDELNPGGSGEDAPSSHVYTVYTLRVDRVLKGPAVRGETIEVMEFGGSLGAKRFDNTTAVHFDRESSYVLYLDRSGHNPATLLNPVQAVYPIVDGRVTVMPGNDIGVPAAIVR